MTDLVRRCKWDSIPDDEAPRLFAALERLPIGVPSDADRAAAARLLTRQPDAGALLSALGLPGGAS